MRELDFHKEIGGRIRADGRNNHEDPAPDIRQLIVEVRRLTGWANYQIAEVIGCSDSVLSMAAGGRAGLDTMPEIVRKLTSLRDTLNQNSTVLADAD